MELNSNQNTLHIDSKALEEIARHAGDIIMAYYNSGEIKPEHKQDGSPVTAADKAAEKYIIAELASLYPDVAAIGEESYNMQTGLPLDGKGFWLIDPLDGTKEFLAKSGDFTVNIAYVSGGKPLAGVVYAPAHDVLYIAGEEGAYRCSKGKREQLSTVTFDKNCPLKIAMSRSHSSEEEAGFLGSLQKQMPVEVVRRGSSLKFCMVADGSADLYFRMGRTMYWDSAAGHAVANACGVLVVNLHTGKELAYDNKDCENQGFIVAERGLVEKFI